MAFIHIGNTDLTSNRNTAKLTLNGSTSTNKFEVWNGANAVLHIAGNNTVWCRGAGNVSGNTAFGELALDSNTSGAENTSFGFSALTNITTSNNCTAFGASSLANATGAGNTAIGRASLLNITSGSSNVGAGLNAGRFITGGVTANQTSSTSVYIGRDTRASANGNSNEIVIGDSVTGNGSNTTTIGNTSTTQAYIRGAVICGDTAALATNATNGFLYVPSCAGTPTGVPTAITGKIPVVVDSTNNKMYIYSGGAWVALN